RGKLQTQCFICSETRRNCVDLAQVRSTVGGVHRSRALDNDKEAQPKSGIAPNEADPAKEARGQGEHLFGFGQTCAASAARLLRLRNSHQSGSRPLQKLCQCPFDEGSHRRCKSRSGLGAQCKSTALAYGDETAARCS